MVQVVQLEVELMLQHGVNGTIFLYCNGLDCRCPHRDFAHMYDAHAVDGMHAREKADEAEARPDPTA